MSLVRREEFILPGRGRLILTKELLDEIDHLHDKVGRTEWCGILFYRHLEGDINEPKSLVLQAEHLYLMDIGSEAYTEADIDVESVIEMDDQIPDVRNLKKGLIHTHHTMNTFFSGTDMSELHDSTPFHNYYLSLIVNFKGEYCAKVAYIATRKTTVNYKNAQDQPIEATSEKEILAMIDMDIEWETPEVVVSDFFRARHEKVKQEKAKKIPAYYPKYTTGTYQSGAYAPQVQRPGFQQPNYNWGEEDDRDARTYTKQAEIPFVNKGGNLVKDGKELRPYQEVYKEIVGKVSDWLLNGVLFGTGSTSDSSVSGLLQYFKEYYDFADNGGDYPFFVNQMQRSMDDMFHMYPPKLVASIGTDILSGYDDNDVCIDLFAMFDSFEKYIADIRAITIEKPPFEKPFKDFVKDTQKEKKIQKKHKVNSKVKQTK